MKHAPRPEHSHFSDLEWPAQLPPPDFAQTVLRVHATSKTEARRRLPLPEQPPRWTMKVALMVFGLGASAATYELANGARLGNSSSADAIPTPAPSFVPLPLGAAVSSAQSEPERAAVSPRKSATSSVTASPPTSSPLDTTVPPAPHYPPCHCGPGGVVCSCVE